MALSSTQDMCSKCYGGHGERDGKGGDAAAAAGVGDAAVDGVTQLVNMGFHDVELIQHLLEQNNGDVRKVTLWLLEHASAV